MNAGMKYVFDQVVGDYLTIQYEAVDEPDDEHTWEDYLLFCKGLVYLMKAEQDCSFEQAYDLVREFDVDGLIPTLKALEER